MSGAILSSWKEIANFLGKGVRTVQRWEAELGLPVHRPSAKRSHLVLADSEELRLWMTSQLGNQPSQPRQLSGTDPAGGAEARRRDHGNGRSVGAGSTGEANMALSKAAAARQAERERSIQAVNQACDQLLRLGKQARVMVLRTDQLCRSAQQLSTFVAAGRNGNSRKTGGTDSSGPPRAS